jgi:hypothetical protein
MFKFEGFMLSKWMHFYNFVTFFHRALLCIMLLKSKVINDDKKE